jgi:hypothetical protein
MNTPTATPTAAAGPIAYENAFIPAAASRRGTGPTTTGAAGPPC